MKRFGELMWLEVMHEMVGHIGIDSCIDTIRDIAKRPEEYALVTYACKHPQGCTDVDFSTVMSSDIISDEVKESIAIERREWKNRVWKKPARQGFVYLIKNHRNGLHKIGWSTKPKAREATLQGEEPELELIAFCPGTYEDESEMHRMFASKRTRGKWFNLNEPEIKSVLEIMALSS